MSVKQPLSILALALAGVLSWAGLPASGTGKAGTLPMPRRKAGSAVPADRGQTRPAHPEAKTGEPLDRDPSVGSRPRKAQRIILHGVAALPPGAPDPTLENVLKWNQKGTSWRTNDVLVR